MAGLSRSCKIDLSMRGFQARAIAVWAGLAIWILQIRQPYGGWKQRWLRLIETAPLTVPAGLAAFGTVAMTCLVLDSFSTWLVLGLGVVPALMTMALAHHIAAGHESRPGSRREQRICDVIVVAGVLFWAAGNLPFAAQHVFTDRDPATYAVAGAWLINHDSVRIPVPTGLGDIAGTTAASLGFNISANDNREIYAQGAHILPALLGLSGRLVGSQAMLHMNVLLGGVALLAVYSLARLLMKPRWALGATAALSISLPMIYFARDTYTEPLALAFIFSSLAFLWYAEHARGNALRRRLALTAWPLAGLALGAGILARIDIYLPVAAIAAFLLVQLAATQPDQRAQAIRQRLAFAIPLGLLGILAWIDLTQLSSGYYRDLRPRFISEMILLATATAGGLTIVAISWQTKLLSLADRATRHWRQPAGIAVLTLFFVYLSSRSLWQTNYAMKDGTAVRSYAEHSLVWMSWYLGPVLAILAIIGIVTISAKILQGKLLKTLPAMCMIAACLYYLINPNISSDQVWASRRFLPVILPGFAVLGFLLLAKFHERKPFTIGGLLFEPRQITAGLAALALVGPLFVSFPFLVTRTYAPQLSQVEYICDNIPANAVVVWAGSAKHTSIQPTQAFCGIPSLGIADAADPSAVIPKLKAAAESQGRQLVIGAKADEADDMPQQLQAIMVRQHSIDYADLEQTYKKFPRNRVLYNRTLVFGELTPTTALVRN